MSNGVSTYTSHRTGECRTL